MPVSPLAIPVAFIVATIPAVVVATIPAVTAILVNWRWGQFLPTTGLLMMITASIAFSFPLSVTFPMIPFSFPLSFTFPMLALSLPILPLSFTLPFALLSFTFTLPFALPFTMLSLAIPASSISLTLIVSPSFTRPAPGSRCCCRRLRRGDEVRNLSLQECHVRHVLWRGSGVKP